MIITALDLGKTFGWATNSKSPWNLRLGSVQIATDKETREWAARHLDRRCDPRFWRFHQWLYSNARGSSVVIFEDVQFCNSRCQCQLWATWRAALWATLPQSCLECVPTNVLKQFAGSGHYDKKDMARAMVMKDPGRFTTKAPYGTQHRRKKAHLVWDKAQQEWLDDNAVDAYWLFKWAEENIQR